MKQLLPKSKNISKDFLKFKPKLLFRYKFFRNTYILTLILIFLLIFVTFGVFYLNKTSSSINNFPINIEGPFLVHKIIDGDTIEIISGTQFYTIRYIGVNSPESVKPNTEVECFGIEASNFNKNLMIGKLVYLEKDVSNVDKFNRLLRYVYIDEGNEKKMVNKIIVEEGYAQAITYTPNIKYQKDLDMLENVAKNLHKGLWEKCNY